MRRTPTTTTSALTTLAVGAALLPGAALAKPSGSADAVLASP